MINLKNYNYGNVNIGLYENGPVGISVSCGADSAIVLYFLMKELKHTLHIYNVIGNLRKRVLEPAVDRVITKCAELTGNNNYVVHKINTTEKPLLIMYETFYERLQKAEVDIIYTGMTKHPPNEDTKHWGILPKWHTEARNYNKYYDEFGGDFNIYDDERMPTTLVKVDKRVYNPIMNNSKKDVAELYRILQVEKELFPFTRSCEDDDHVTGHCGKCWWCNERVWGFGYLE